MHRGTEVVELLRHNELAPPFARQLAGNLADPVVAVDPDVDGELADAGAAHQLAEGRGGFRVQPGGRLGHVDGRGIVRGLRAADPFGADGADVRGEPLQVAQHVGGVLTAALKLLGQRGDPRIGALGQIELDPGLTAQANPHRGRQLLIDHRTDLESPNGADLRQGQCQVDVLAREVDQPGAGQRDGLAVDGPPLVEGEPRRLRRRCA